MQKITQQVDVTKPTKIKSLIKKNKINDSIANLLREGCP